MSEYPTTAEEKRAAADEVLSLYRDLVLLGDRVNITITDNRKSLGGSNER